MFYFYAWSYKMKLIFWTNFIDTKLNKHVVSIKSVSIKQKKIKN